MTTGVFRKAHWVALVAALTVVPSFATARSAVPRIWKSCPTTYEAFQADLQARRQKLSKKLAGLSDDQNFQFAKSHSLDAKLLRLLWPDLVRDPVASGLWSMCLDRWGEIEDALKEKRGAHLDDAIKWWEICLESSYREAPTPPATELVACAKSLATSWPRKD